MAIGAPERRALLGMLPLPDGTFDAGDRKQFTTGVFRNISVIVYEGNKILAPVETSKTWDEVFTDEGWTTFQDQIDAGYPYWMQPSNATNGVWEEKIDYGETFTSAIITLSYQETTVDGSVTVTPTISYSSDDVSYTDVVDDKQALATDFRYVKINLEFDGDDRTSLVIVEGIRVRVDVKTALESGRVEVTSNPTAITYATDFKDTAKPSGNSESTTAKIVTFSSPTKDGVDVYIHNTDGTDASGSGVYVNWKAEGPIA